MRTLTACLLTIALLPGCGATARTWTSVSGATLEAEYTGRDGPTIFLQRENGSQLKIQLDKLSQADQAYLESLAKPADTAKQPTSTQPTPTATRALFGAVSYAPAAPLTTAAFPTVSLNQPDTATYWGFQYGPAADEVLYVVFDQPTVTDLHDTAFLYSPGHPAYATPVALPAKRGKLEDQRVMKFSDITLQARHDDVNVMYDLEFIYGIERPDILTAIVHGRVERQGARSTFVTGSHINEDAVNTGTIPVVHALRPVHLDVSSRNTFGNVDAYVRLHMNGWHLVPKSGMDKTILLQVVDGQSGKVEEKVKVELKEDAVTSHETKRIRTRLEEVERGMTYQLNASIDLGPVLGVATNSRPLKMPAEKDDD